MTTPSASADLRNAMVDKLLEWGSLHTAPVEAAMRAVPRHLFVPKATVEQAYGNDSVATHRGSDGRSISCASAPGIVAAMLEQLDVRPGHRVLEVGAGTGYNAACLTELAGPSGRVTTVDIGEEIVAGARRGLAAAGYDRVRVVVGDGAEGVPDDAPYDRIIVTAGAWDVPPAWREQLAPGGRLVVPLRVKGITRAVGLELDGDVWRSVSATECGFVPMRGDGASVIGELSVELPGVGVYLRVDDGQTVDAARLGAALNLPPSLAWSGTVVELKPFEGLDFWLAGASAGVCRVMMTPQALESGVVEAIYRWGSMGCYTGDSFAYLVRRNADGRRIELGACAYGPEAEQLAGEVADRLKAWSTAQGRLRLEVHPAGSADRPALITADKFYSRIFVNPT